MSKDLEDSYNPFNPIRSLELVKFLTFRHQSLKIIISVPQLENIVSEELLNACTLKYKQTYCGIPNLVTILSSC